MLRIKTVVLLTKLAAGPIALRCLPFEDAEIYPKNTKRP